MKKSLLALAVLGAFAGAASAQSSVTIYGNIQLGVQKVSGVDPVLDVAPGYNQVGFRGNEVLNPDLSAIFDLQLRFSPESGGNDGTWNASGAAPDQNRGPFQGKSVVGLSSKSMGTLTVGRQLTPYSVYEAKADPLVALGGGAGTSLQGSVDILALGWYADPTPGGIRSNAGLARTDMIHYASPTWSGFNVTYGYGLKRSGASGAVLQQNKNFQSLWVNYTVGPFSLGLGGENNRRGDKARAINATYDLKVAKLGLGYGTIDTEAGTVTSTYAVTGANPTGTVFTGIAGGPKSKRTQVGVSVPMGPWMFGIGYGQIKAEGSGEKRTNKFGLGAHYALSSRTYVVATYKQDKNKGTGASAYGVAGGTTQKGLDLTLRHNF